MLHPFPEAGLHTVTFVSGSGQHQFVHQFRVPDSDLQGGRAPVAEAHQIRFLDMELLEQGGHIIGVLFEAQRAIDIRGMPVGLQLCRDHLMCFCQFRQDAAERGHYGRAPAV